MTGSRFAVRGSGRTVKRGRCAAVRALQRRACVLGALGSLAACGDSALDTNDVLHVSFEPGFLVVDAHGSLTDCAGGAHVQLAASHADGEPAERAEVQLWLSSTATAVLSTDHVELSADGTSSAACLVPGDSPGTTTLHARSGPIETLAMIDVRAREVPAMGTLALVVAPATDPRSPQSTCGSGGCTPLSQRAAVTVLGAGSATVAVPDRALVHVSTTGGWLSTTGCADATGPNTVDVELAGGQASAYLCDDENGGTAMLAAHSGAVSATAQVTFRPVIHGLDLTPSRATAAAGNPLQITAFVFDCGMQPIANTSVTLQITAGAFDLDATSSPTGTTSAAGTVVFSGTVRAVPLTATAHLLGASQVSCAATIGGAP